MFEQSFDRRAGHGLRRGELSDECRVALCNADGLRLLKHDLADQCGPGRALVSPGQVACVGGEPGFDALSVHCPQA